MQEEEGIERPIAYASCKLSSAERRCGSKNSSEQMDPQTDKLDNSSGITRKVYCYVKIEAGLVVKATVHKMKDGL
ncbi:hypothetical protein Y1Q_0014707 [Alligator mississippiensis]|uniref:Uncharacterized protein n=1 Tax=Alligator mississippiensis TaxID=8496 RepID=A0A151P897_ALLMI|nr:hypothetical protein Y1Q_0014707 [Alligator mississippiensis]